MGNSTISVQDTVDLISAMGDVSPTAQPSGYAPLTTLAIAQDTMNDFIAQTFNWKWNSKNARPFLTNSWQQDYPQLGLNDVGWLEGGWWLDINNPIRPVPNGIITAVEDIEISNERAAGPPVKVSWHYNRQLNYGVWPGATSVYTPLMGTPVAQNPPTAILDDNGNILTLTTFGTTGATAPIAPAGAAEGTFVNDGSCVWTVVDPNGQGFRVYPLAPANGPVYQVNVAYQQKAKQFKSVDDLLDPIPDDFAHHYRRGFKAYAYAYSPDPKARSQFPGPSGMHAEWLGSLRDATTQADREFDGWMLLPATHVVEDPWRIRRNPLDPSRPY